MKNLFFMFLVAFTVSAAQISISDIATPTGKYLVVSKPIVVASGDTLTVQQGREVLFTNFSGITVSAGGSLIASGIKDLPIYFTSLLDTAGSAAAFDWNGIEVKKGAFARFDYCFIAFSSSGITAEDSTGIELHDCIFSVNGQWNFSLSGVITQVPDLQPFSYSPKTVSLPTPKQAVSDTVSTPAPLPVQSKSFSLKKRDIILGGGAVILAAAGAAAFYKAKEYHSKYNAYVPGNPDFDAASIQTRQAHFDHLRRKYKIYSAVAWPCFGIAAADVLFLALTVKF